MNRQPTLLIVLLLASSPTQLDAESTKVIPKRSGPPQVLLLPSPSETLIHELSARGEILEVHGGPSQATSLKGLREDASALEAIRGGGWDFVVLTGHPTFGKTLLIDGVFRVGDPSELLHHGRMLLEEIRRSGARPILLVPPPGPGAPAIDRQAVEWAYHRLGLEGGAALAPVAEAFARVRRRRPDLSLFDPYGEGWSSAGATLATAVLEATITGRPPGASVTPAAERAGGAGLPVEAQGLLNEEAWGAVRDLAAAGGYRDVPPPPFPAVPTLARGEPVARARLQGTWRGPLRLYPWPTTLVLEVFDGAEGLRVAGRVHFEGDRPDLGFEAADTDFEGSVLSFFNPSDLAHGRTLYRLVAQGGRLTGVAELVTENGSIYAVGGLELERVERRAAHQAR